MILVGCGWGPALLGADLLHHVDIVERRLDRVVGLHRRIGIDVAAGAVIVSADIEPVVDSAHDDLGSVDVGYRAVLENHVHDREILDVVVVATQVAFVAIGRELGDGVGAGADRRGAYRLAVTT